MMTMSVSMCVQEWMWGLCVCGCEHKYQGVSEKTSPALLWYSVSALAPFLTVCAATHNKSRGRQAGGGCLFMFHGLALGLPGSSSPPLPARRQRCSFPALCSWPLTPSESPPIPTSCQSPSNEGSFRSWGGILPSRGSPASSRDPAPPPNRSGTRALHPQEGAQRPSCSQPGRVQAQLQAR